MSQWQPLSQFAEFATDVPPAAPPPGAEVPPGGAAVPPPGPGAAAAPAAAIQVLEARSGLPWEHRESRGFLNSFADTLAMVLTKPANAFTVMRTEGGFGGPLLFAVIGGAIGAVIAFVLALLASSFGLVGNRHGTMGAMFGMTLSWVGFLFRLIMVALAPFIWAALVHVSLMLLGGAKKTYETTFRVIAFSQGATAPLQLVPCCGGLIAVIWNLVASCIGISRAHEIDTGRAIMAVVLPLIVCCGGVIFIAFLFGGLAALGSHNWSQ